MPPHPFEELVDLIEQAVVSARDHWVPSAESTENGMIAWVVTQELRRAGYRIVSPTGYTYPDDTLLSGVS
jgi:hypothetical protein